MAKRDMVRIGLAMILLSLLSRQVNSQQIKSDTAIPTPVTAVQAPARVVEIINDSAMLKLLVFDLSQNLLGIGWTDRERGGIGRDKLINNAKKISAKYGFDVTKVNLRTDVYGPVGGSTFDFEMPQVYITVSDTWFEIVHFKNSERLPIVKFKSGKITLILNKLKVYFADGTECMVDGEEYMYRDGNWLQKKERIERKRE